MENVITVLGSTGSVGTQTLEVAKHLGIKIYGLTGNDNIDLMAAQIRYFKPDVCVMADDNNAALLRTLVADTNTKIYGGKIALCEVAASENADIVVNACVGFSGLRPTLAAIHSRRRIALANKETLVAGGSIVMDAAKRNGVDILPVDSEHSAIYQCLAGNNRSCLETVILTASGGSMRGKSRTELENATIQQVMAHPTWNMGRKITVDSATLMNKALEIIEAAWLYDLPEDKVEVVVHPQSIVHSLIRFCDGSVLAQMGMPDMRMCIQYALTYPERQKSICKPLDLASVGKLTFEAPDTATFGLMDTAREAFRKGGTAPCVMNGANEAAVELFLDGRIPFLDIELMVNETLSKHSIVSRPTVEDIEEADRWGRETVISLKR